MSERNLRHASKARSGSRLRCVAHDLACDEQGHCVVCRRERGLGSQPAPPVRASPSPRVWLLGVAVVVLAAVGVALASRAPAPTEVVAAGGQGADEMAAAAERAAAHAAAEAARAERAERAERMRERAEALRLARERQRLAEDGLSAESRAPVGELSVEDLQPPPVDPSAELDRRVAELRRERERDDAQRALARARDAVEIHLYSAHWCGVCTRARAYMEAEGIAFVEHDVDDDLGARATFVALNPRRTLPTFDIDGRVMVGFTPRALEQALQRATLARVR